MLYTQLQVTLVLCLNILWGRTIILYKAGSRNCLKDQREIAILYLDCQMIIKKHIKFSLESIAKAIISCGYRKMAYTVIFNCHSANNLTKLKLQVIVEYQQSHRRIDRG